jgi:hypothetical protein
MLDRLTLEAHYERLEQQQCGFAKALAELRPII